MNCEILTTLLLDTFLVVDEARVCAQVCESLAAWVKSWDRPRVRSTQIVRIPDSVSINEYFRQVAQLFCAQQDRQIFVELWLSKPDFRESIAHQWHRAEVDGGWLEATITMVIRILGMRDRLVAADAWNREFPGLAPQIGAVTEVGLRAAILESLRIIENWQVHPDAAMPAGDAQTFFQLRVLAARVRAYELKLNIKLLLP